ncbi:MAG: hypothetical protein LBU88_09850 [Treponema sp.]|jgi:hypothetical protein|nr:hypothetical protein [Treponema sp.]
MPNIENMLEIVRKNGISEETISKFKLPRTKKANPNEIVEFINQSVEIIFLQTKK